MITLPLGGGKNGKMLCTEMYQVLRPQVQVQVQVLRPQVQVRVQVPKLQVQVQVPCVHCKYALSLHLPM